MKILVTGSTGFVGSALVPFLKIAGHQVIKLVRTRANLLPDEIAWDLDRGVISPEALEGIEGVVHLAGENIADSRWDEAKKKRILDSRAKGTRLLCEALSSLKNPPKVLVSASATGYYGSRGDEKLTEQSLAGSGFLAYVCKEWEAATKPACDKSIRVVNLRIGIVLSPKGGVLKKMLLPFKWGFGGPLGSGKQYMSWIAMDDLLMIIGTALQQESIKGPINAVSPNPVNNLEFTREMGKVLHRPTFMRLPEFVLRTLFGEAADEILLASARVYPRALLNAGFLFAYPTLEGALSYLLEKSR